VPPVERGPITTTSCAPTGPPVVVAVMVVALSTTAGVTSVPAMVTREPGTNPDPVMVTLVPPPCGPLAGEMPVTTGGGSQRSSLSGISCLVTVGPS
jgi:hypothetical protein